MSNEMIDTIKTITHVLIIITVLQIILTGIFFVYRFKIKASKDKRKAERRFFQRRTTQRPPRYHERRLAERRSISLLF